MDILNNGEIRTVFQPIISLRDGSVFGYEALSRGPEKTCLESPGSLFEYAEKNSHLWELELFYNQDDLDKGYIVTKNRHGIEESFTLLTITVTGLIVLLVC